MEVSDGRVMRSECEREEEWGNRWFLQVEEERVSGC